MILSISVKPENILFNENGQIIIKLDYHSGYSNSAYLLTTDGKTLEDFEDSDCKKCATLWIGSNGGIILQRP